MKQLKCEMCGSCDMIKQDGLFVCQSCGVKYSLEEARKLMIEGVVDVSGSTVKIDDSEHLINYFQMAQNAFDSKNFKEAENYCNKILESDFKDYKAWQLKGKSAGNQATADSLHIDEVINCFTKAIENAPEEEKSSLQASSSAYMKEFLLSATNICCNDYAVNPSEENSKNVETKTSLFILKYNNIISEWGGDLDDFKKQVAATIFSNTLSAWDNIILKEYMADIHPTKDVWNTFMNRAHKAIELIQISLDNSKEQICDKCNQMIKITLKINDSYGCNFDAQKKEYYYFRPFDEYKSNNAKINEWSRMIYQIDPTFKVAGKKGCYIATAVYGSYNCPEVWTLRRYRDYDLAKKWYGQTFIKIYYAISPKLVSWFGDKKWFKVIWKKKLDRLIKRLHRQGYLSTPYEDCEW